MAETHQFTHVIFRGFTAFETFTPGLRHFEILAGPKNELTLYFPE